MAAVQFRPLFPPGSSRSKLRPSPGGCSWCRVVCRRCGNTPPREFADGLRSSYEPPVRGPIHYRLIVGKGSNHRLVPLLAVVSFLLLFGLPSGIVLGLVLPVVVVVLLFGWRWRRGCRLLQLPHPRFHRMHKANVLVILHYAA